jgi:CSLREA domain-containing protein
MNHHAVLRSTFLLLLLAIFWSLAGPAAAASTIVVDTTDDVVADDGLCSLREAIIAANNGASFSNCPLGSAPYTIEFAPALPTPATFTLTLSGAGEDAGLAGDLDLSGAFTITGAGVDSTIIDGNGEDRVLHIHPAANISITGITIRNGNPGVAANGGGIAIEQTGRLTLNSAAVSNNTAVFGGGAYNLGRLTMNDNTVSTNQGGGLYNNGGLLTLNNVQVLENTQGFGIVNEQSGFLQYNSGEVRQNGSGGVLNNSSTAELTGLTIAGHSNGSGLYNKGSGNTTLMIKNSTINNNSATSGAGLLNASASAKATIENTRFSANIASVNGGGISNSGILTLKNSVVDNNQARTGGGIDHQGLSFLAQNVTISGNTAIDNGGGIANQKSATLNNVTLSGNNASGPETGGNLFNDGDSPQVIFANTIVANPGPGGNCVTTVGAMTSLGHNLESTNTCNFIAAGDLANTDPLLGPLQDNGGPTPTHALLPGSPAIDQGDNAQCPADDQRGVARPVGPSCDIGAFEAGGTTPTYALDLSPDAAKSAPPGQTVIYTLTLTNQGNGTDIFDLSTSGNLWTTILSDSQLALTAGQSANITATVAIPTGTSDKITDIVSIIARSRGDSSKSDSVNLATTSIVILQFYLPVCRTD